MLSRTTAGLGLGLVVAAALGAATQSGDPAAPWPLHLVARTAPDVATVSSAAAAGGQDALVEAARREGRVNVIGVPRDRSNYGQLMDSFTKRYGIAVVDVNPRASDADQLAAAGSSRGRADAPDVVDLATGSAMTGAGRGLFAPYRVARWKAVPGTLKDADGRWFGAYGSYLSIACDAARMRACPTSLAQLEDPAYRGKVALAGGAADSSALAAVWAAALARGGSLGDARPGLDFLVRLRRAGVLLPTAATTATVQAGRTPVVLDWDSANVQRADELKTKGHRLSVTVPERSRVAGYRALAVSRNAAHPAAARLWEEYLSGEDGQNGFLLGYARPAELDAMRSSGKVERVLADKLPPVPGTPELPTAAQAARAQALVALRWSSLT